MIVELISAMADALRVFPSNCGRCRIVLLSFESMRLDEVLVCVWDCLCVCVCACFRVRKRYDMQSSSVDTMPRTVCQVFTSHANTHAHTQQQQLSDNKLASALVLPKCVRRDDGARRSRCLGFMQMLCVCVFVLCSAKIRKESSPVLVGCTTVAGRSPLGPGVIRNAPFSMGITH